MTRATENPSQPTPADHPPTPPAPVAATTTCGPATPPAPADRRAWAGLAVLCLVLLVVTMDTSILFFAAPHLAADLRPSATELLWIFDIYGFVLAGLLITMGSLADSLGRRRVLLGGATLYAVASLAAAYAPTAAALIAARALLGVGGATLMPSTLALVRTLFRDERQRALAVGIWSGVMSGGVGLGPVLAGVLLERYWWGSVFVVNLPVVALLLVLGPRLLPESRAPRSSVDLAGSALLLAGILPLVHVLKSATTQGWSPTGHLPWLAVGVGALTLFVRRESRVAAPMVDLSLLRRPAFPATLLLQVIAMFGVMGNAVLMTAYLQSVLGMSVLSAALWSLAPSVGVGLAAPGSALLSRALGRPIVMALGCLLAGAGFVAMRTTGSDSSLALVLSAAGLVAVGTVAVATLVTDYAVSVAPADRAGSVAALVETAAELGGAVGMAVLGSVMSARYADRLHAAPDLGSLPAGVIDAAARTIGEATVVAAQLGAQGEPLLRAAREAYVVGMHAADLVAAAIMLLGALVALVLHNGPTRCQGSGASRLAMASGTAAPQAPVDQSVPGETHTDVISADEVGRARVALPEYVVGDAHGEVRRRGPRCGRSVRPVRRGRARSRRGLVTSTACGTRRPGPSCWPPRRRTSSPSAPPSPSRPAASRPSSSIRRRGWRRSGCRPTPAGPGDARTVRRGPPSRSSCWPAPAC